MGIKNLKYLINKYAASAVNERYLYSYENKVIAIDTSIYLYRFIYKNGEPIELLVKQIMRFLKNKVTPLYIFDGKPPKEKSDVLDERSERKKELIERQKQIRKLIEKKEDKKDTTPVDIQDQEQGKEQDQKVGDVVTYVEDVIPVELIDLNLEELKEELEKVDKRIIVVNGKIISDCKHLFRLMGVPYIVANGEAESLCAKLSQNGLVYGCLSEDTDILANGGRYFIRNFNVNNNKIIEYDFDKMLKLFGLTYAQFIDVCILCGCDYTCTIKNIGLEKGYKFIKEYGNMEGLIKFIETENKRFAEKNKDIRYVVPKEFDYVKARELFVNCGNNEDYKVLKKMIKLEVPQIDSLLQYLVGKAKIPVMNDIKRNLKKLYQNIEADKMQTIDNFF